MSKKANTIIRIAMILILILIYGFTFYGFTHPEKYDTIYKYQYAQEGAKNNE